MKSEYVRITKAGHRLEGLIYPIEEYNLDTRFWVMRHAEILIAKEDCEPFEFAPLQEDQHIITTQQIEEFHKALGDCTINRESLQVSFASWFTGVFAPAQTTTYRRGDRLLIDDCHYLIATIKASTVGLFDLETGARIGDGLEVENTTEIPEADLKYYVQQYYGDFNEFTKLPDTTDQLI